MKLCDVDDFHSYLEIEQYLSLPKDMNILISLKEMYRIHELLCKYQDFLVSFLSFSNVYYFGPPDRIHELLCKYQDIVVRVKS